jgi:hypothetical protein
MKRHVTRTVMLATSLLVMAAISPAIAQDSAAEVRTWSGQSVVLAGPWVDVFYTAVPRGEEAPVPPGGAPAPPMGAGGTQPEIRGSFQSLKHAFPAGPQTLPAHRETSVLTFSRAGVELKVPLERLATLTIVRQAVAGSSLPPYVSPTHQRYSATATLTDGSRIDADYLNFGTAVLRGMTSQGRVDVPFDQIESIRFTR